VTIGGNFLLTLLANSHTILLTLLGDVVCEQNTAKRLLSEISCFHFNIKVKHM